MRKLTIKQLTNISLLIAISVGMVYFGMLMMGMSSIPNLRAGFAGIPIKMAGFIYGPVVGVATGAIADILGILVFPTFYHPGYTIDLMIAGFIPGVIGVMYRKYKTGDFGLSVVANSIIIFLMLSFFSVYIADRHLGFLTTPLMSVSILMYSCQMALALILYNVTLHYLKKRESKFVSSFSLISIFVLITDNIVLFLAPLWDQQAMGIPYVTGVQMSMMYFGLKTLFNVVLLFIVFSVLSKQISKQSEYNQQIDITQVTSEFLITEPNVSTIKNKNPELEILEKSPLKQKETNTKDKPIE